MSKISMNADITDGPLKPGDNPNSRNLHPRKSVRPRTKNSSSTTNTSMRLNWIDPLPVVDALPPLGLEPNPESFPAGEIDLSFDLPNSIAEPFAELVHSVGDRIQLDDDAKVECADSLRGMSYFKSARQLFSTMLDTEKSLCQPLKSVYYDETPIPSHMAAGIGIIGHIETKVGKVIVRNAPTLFKRWIAKGLQVCPGNDFSAPIDPDAPDEPEDPEYAPDPSKLVWPDEDGRSLVSRLAREKIASLTDLTYTLQGRDGNQITVSMPRLVNQRLPDYYAQIHDGVPQADVLRRQVALLQLNRSTWQNGTLGHDLSLVDALADIGLVRAHHFYLMPGLREGFEDTMTHYVVGAKNRIEAILKTTVPTAGSSGFGAQLVQSEKNVARWSFPLSDADANIGFLFSPNKYFSLNPRVVAYSKRDKDSANAAFAQKDGKAFV
jgi:hypothetical protein